jgi:hypothetical protein
MSVNFYQTTGCNNPEDNHIHTPFHENLISHILGLSLPPLSVIDGMNDVTIIFILQLALREQCPHPRADQ